MMKSTLGDIIRKGTTVVAWASALGLAGGVIALLIGLLTFGVQATAKPSHVPLGIGAPQPVVDRLQAQSGDQVDWRAVGSQAEAERLLDERSIYGAVLIEPGRATVLLSGAVNPGATQAAQPILTQVGMALVAAAPPPAQAQGRAPSVRVVTIHPVPLAGLAMPLTASLLLWLTTFFASILANVALPRQGRALGRPGLLLTAAVATAAGTALVVGLARLWDPSLVIGWDTVGFLALVGAAFALLQIAVLRWLGLAGIPLLVLLYLMAPAAAGLVPELINPVYRALIWDWTPFRFSTEAFRSLFTIGSTGPGVGDALRLFAAIAGAGLLLVLAPRPGRHAPLAVSQAA